MTNRICYCAGWRENIDKVNGPIVLQTLRSGGNYQYDGQPFTHCPWCGKPLTEGDVAPPAAPEREPLPVEPSEAAIEAARRAMVRADCAETKAWLVRKWHVSPDEAQAMIGEALQDVEGYGPLVEIAVRAAYTVDFTAAP